MAIITPPAARRRGRVATHDLETLLDLLARGAREAVSQGKSMIAARVSMPVFNVVKVDLDRARGIADPHSDPERTPTAEAIQMRFGQLAGRPVKWGELVDGALRSGRERIMWLAALSRDQPRDDLTDELVIHALRFVARRRKTDTLTRGQYDDTQKTLVSDDVARHGDDALLVQLLPTSNQLLAYCNYSWAKALKLADLKPYLQPRPAREGASPPSGLPLAEAMALYGALNGVWPSRAVLQHFAGVCGVAISDTPAGGIGPIREEAGRLLRAEGITAPSRTRGGGKGRRLTYRYPANGIPGAPLRHARRDSQPPDPRLDELLRELAVVSLRVWLAGLHANARRVRAEYVTWQVGTNWTRVGVFDQHNHGGFSALKQEASDENARVRRAGSDPLVESLARADAIRAEIELIGSPTAGVQPDPVPFAVALRSVLAGPHAEAQPPRQ